MKDKLRKLQHEREQLECQLKTEKDEKELYKVIGLFLSYAQWAFWVENLRAVQLSSWSLVSLQSGE